MHIGRLGTNRHISKCLCSGERFYQIGPVNDTILAAVRADPGVLHVQFQVACRVPLSFPGEGPLWTTLPNGTKISSKEYEYSEVNSHCRICHAEGTNHFNS